MEDFIFFMFVWPSVWRAGVILLLLNEHPASFIFVIVTKIPLDLINEALYYFLTISHEMSVGLKKSQKKYFYRKSKHVLQVKYMYPKDVPFKKFKYILHCQRDRSVNNLNIIWHHRDTIYMQSN